MLLDICETHSFDYFRKYQATFLTASDNFLTRLSTLGHDLHPAVLLRPSKPSPAFPSDAPNSNPREAKPYPSPETKTEHSSFSPAFARRPDRAVHQNFRPGSALEGPSHRHRHSRCAPQAQCLRRRGRRRVRCIAAIRTRVGTYRRVPGEVIDVFNAVLRIFDTRDTLGTTFCSIVHDIHRGDPHQPVSLPSATPSFAPRHSRARSGHGESLRGRAIRDRLVRGGELETEDAALQVGA
jgi:hypothetical protein